MGYSWTDDPLISHTTLIKRDHLIELYQNLNLERQKRGLDPIPIPPDNIIKTEHIEELRQAIEETPLESGCLNHNVNVFTSEKYEAENNHNQAIYTSHWDTVRVSERTNVRSLENPQCREHFLSADTQDNVNIELHHYVDLRMNQDVIVHSSQTPSCTQHDARVYSSFDAYHDEHVALSVYSLNDHGVKISNRLSVKDSYDQGV